MTTEDKAAAFDALAEAFTNRWEDGHWSWWVANPAGGPARAHRSEAVADLLAWCREFNRRRRRVLGLPTAGPASAP